MAPQPLSELVEVVVHGYYSDVIKSITLVGLMGKYAYSE